MKSVLLILSFAMIGAASANEVTKNIASAEAARICSLLLSGNPKTVRLAGGQVEVLGARSRSYLAQLPQGVLPLTEVLMTLPYGKAIVDQIPELLEFEWFSTATAVYTSLFTKNGNEAVVRLHRHGYFDIRIGPSLNLPADRVLYEELIGILHTCGSKSLIFTNPVFEASTDGDELGLWLTHLELDQPHGRRCIRQLLGALRN